MSKPFENEQRSTQYLRALTSEQMRRIDQVVAQKFFISSEILMENAGRLTAYLSTKLCHGKVHLVIGPGNNGGDGLTAARYLHQWGRLGSVILAVDQAKLKDLPRLQLQRLNALGVQAQPLETKVNTGAYDLLIDAILGTAPYRPPEGPIATAIKFVNDQMCKKLALDLPSGIDADTGNHTDVCVKADFTLTLGAPKVGLVSQYVRYYVGELYVADIGIPKEAYSAIGIQMDLPYFGPEQIIGPMQI